MYFFTWTFCEMCFSEFKLRILDDDISFKFLKNVKTPFHVVS